MDNINRNIRHPFGVAVHSGFVFWTDLWTTPGVYRADLDGTNQKLLQEAFDYEPHDLTFVSSTRPGGRPRYISENPTC